MASKSLRDLNDLQVTALVQRPKHAQAIGILTIEISRLERSISELLGTILGMHFLLAEAIYFTPNSNIARMDIISNVAPLALNQHPKKVKRINRFNERAKAAMGKRHQIIHYFWTLSETGDDIRGEKMGGFRLKTFSLKQLEAQILDVQKLTTEIYKYCHGFRDEHPKDIRPLREYW